MLGVGAVLMTSAARSAATTVPVSVGPGGMLVFNPANVTAHQGDTVKWTWDSSGHTTTDTTGLGLWDSNIRSVHATFTHKFVHAGAFGYHGQVHFMFGMVGSVKVPLMLTRAGSKVTVRWASSAPAAGFVEDVQQQMPGAASFTAGDGFDRPVEGDHADERHVEVPGAIPQGRDRQGQRLLARGDGEDQLSAA
jgi:plastocyanin